MVCRAVAARPPGNCLPVGAPAGGPHCLSAAFEPANRRARGWVPNVNAADRVGTDGLLAVGREGPATRTVLMPVVMHHLLAGGRIENVGADRRLQVAAVGVKQPLGIG